MLNDPVYHNVWTNLHDHFSESFKNFCVVIMIGCLCSRNPLSVKNIHGIKEVHEHEFHFWLGHACFLWHSKLWRLIFESYGIKPTLDTTDNSVLELWDGFHFFPADQHKHSTAHPAVAMWDSWTPSWHKFFSSPALQSVSNERFPGPWPLHQQSFWLFIFVRIELLLLPMLRCRLSVLVMVVPYAAHLHQGFCLQKTFCATWCSWHYIISNGLLKFPGCCGGILTEFNAQDGIPLRDLSCFPLHDKFHKHFLTRQASTPHWGTAQPLQVGIEERPRSKVVCVSSLLYCQ